MAKGTERRPEQRPELLTAGIEGIHHETRGERGFCLKNLVESLGEAGGCPAYRAFPQKSSPAPHAAQREHRIKFCQRGRRSDSSHGRDRGRPGGGRIHGRDRVQSPRRREGYFGEGIRFRHFLEKGSSGIAGGGLWRQHRGDAEVEFSGQSNPELKTERIGEFRAPVAAERDTSRQAANDFIGQKPERARAIARATDGIPERNLLLNRRDHLGVFENGEICPVQSPQSGTVRENLADGNGPFSSAAEFRPDVRNPRLEPDVRRLHRMEKARRCHAFRGRPDQDQRILLPRELPGFVAEPAAKRENFLPVLPDRNGGPDFAALRKVVFESLPNIRNRKFGHGITGARSRP